MNNYYVYEYIRLDTNEVFYIGKGKPYNNMPATLAATTKKRQKVINIKTGQIFESIKEAAKSVNLSNVQLGRLLKNWYPNYTDLRKVG